MQVEKLKKYLKDGIEKEREVVKVCRLDSRYSMANISFHEGRLVAYRETLAIVNQLCD